MTSFCTEGATIALILAKQVPRVLTMKPDVVLLIWDSDAVKDTSTDGYPTQAYNNSLTKTLNTLLSNHITVLVTSPLLLGENEIPFFSPWSKKVKLDNYRSVTKEISIQLGAIYVDGRKALLDAISNCGYCNSNSYSVCSPNGANTCGSGVVTVNGQHLNNNGAQILASLYAHQLNNWFSPNYTANVESTSSSAKCFAGFETVELESGDSKPLSELIIGDRIRVVSIDGLGNRKDFFSPVIALPHPRGNTELALFHTITTDRSNRSLTVTPDHLILSGACGDKLSLRPASSARVGECLYTLPGPVRIIQVERKILEGVYTAVTLESALLVVNGIVASPFAVNHLLVDSFYNIHRFLYRFILPASWKMTTMTAAIPIDTLVARSLDSFVGLLEGLSFI